MINNPIIQREFIGTLRSKRALVVQVLLVAVLSTLVVARWPGDARVGLTGEESRQVLSVFGFGLLVVLVLLAPIFPATGLVREKQQGTLALLLNSPLGGLSIAAGKLVGALGFIFLLMVLSFPPAAACYTMGGVSFWGDLVGMYALLALLALQYATLAMLVSSFSGSTDGALRTTYALVLLLAVVSLGPDQFFGGIADEQSLIGALAAVPALGPALASVAGVLMSVVDLIAVIDWSRCVSPIPAMFDVLGQGGGGAKAAAIGTDAGLSVASRYMILAGVSSAVFFLWTVARLNQRLLDKARASGKVTNERSTSAQLLRRLMFLWFFDPQRRSGLIGPLTNPVMVKEFRCRKFGRGHWLMRIFGLVLIVSLLLALATTRGTMDWGVEMLGGVMVMLQVSLIILITPSLAAPIISSERESGGWALMQMTPLGAFRIVTGKLTSVMLTLLLILLGTLPAYVLLIAIKPDLQDAVVRVLISLGLTALFSMLLSAAISSIFARTAIATTVSYTLLVGLCMGTLLIWLGQDAPFSFALVESVLRSNPLAAAMSLIDTPGFADYRLVPANWWLMGIASAVCLVVLSIQTWRLTRPR